MFIPLKMLLIGINPHPHWISDPNGRSERLPAAPAADPPPPHGLPSPPGAAARHGAWENRGNPGDPGDRSQGETRGNPGNIQKDVENPWVSGGSSSILEKNPG